jgi:hypothetical protein
MSNGALVITLVLSACVNVFMLFQIAWLCDKLEAAAREHERIRALLDEAREFARECMAQSKRMADVAVHGVPRIKGA